MKKILIHPSTELYLGRGILTSDFLLPFLGKLKQVVITDETVKELYGGHLARQIGAELLTIPIGEQAKSWETLQNLTDELIKRGCGRDTLLIALGGGVTTDLVGFAASIYMRGVSLIFIPTTLLAMVDASIGGKTAIDTSHGKNLIGTLYPPQAIFADLEMLHTLSEKEWFNGLAEIIKMGLIHDPSLWEMAVKNRKDPTLILGAIQGKISIVEQDPNEQSLRRILNFGHTIGHALEAVADYALPHGEAVALGCIVEAYLSMQLGYLSEAEFRQIQDMYSFFPLQLPKSYVRETFIKAMQHDKKKMQGAVRFVLIDKIGHAMPFDGAYCRALDINELETGLDWMEKTF